MLARPLVKGQGDNPKLFQRDHAVVSAVARVHAAALKLGSLGQSHCPLQLVHLPGAKLLRNGVHSGDCLGLAQDEEGARVS